MIFFSGGGGESVGTILSAGIGGRDKKVVLDPIGKSKEFNWNKYLKTFPNILAKMIICKMTASVEEGSTASFRGSWERKNFPIFAHHIWIRINYLCFKQMSGVKK